MVVHSSRYKRVSKRNTFTVVYKNCFGKCYGYVQKYIKVLFACSNTMKCNNACICQKYQYLAILQTPHVLPNIFTGDNYTGSTLDHLIPVTHKTFLDVCFVHDILDISCKVSCPKNNYIVMFPNKYEKD